MRDRYLSSSKARVYNCLLLAMSSRRRIVTSDDEESNGGAERGLAGARDSDEEWDADAMGAMNAFSQEAEADSSGDIRFPKGALEGGNHRILESRIDDDDNVEFYVQFETTTSSSSSSSNFKNATIKQWRREADVKAMMPSVVQRWRSDTESKSSGGSRPRRGAASQAISKISQLSRGNGVDDDANGSYKGVDDDDNCSEAGGSDDDTNKRRKGKLHATPAGPGGRGAAVRQSSGRSKSLASKSAQRRQEALEELTKNRRGLSALSGSDEEYVESDGSDEADDGTASVESQREDFFARRKPAAKKKQAAYRKPRTPEPSEGGDSDIDDFIVNSDEEREEEERLLREEREARRSKKAAQKQKELDKRARREERGPSSGAKRKKGLQDGEGEDEGLVVVRSSQKRNRRSILMDEEDERTAGGGDSNIDVDEEEDDDDGGDDDADDESVGGAMTYWQVDAMREEKRDAMEGLTMFASRRSYSREEAMRVYIEYLGRAHEDPSFVAHIAAEPESPDGRKFLAASRQIENLICTSRESLLGSGAWNKEFVAELQSRPFYSVENISAQKVLGRCLACNRTSHALGWKAALFGARYDAKRAFSVLRWDREMPDAIFLCSERGINSQHSSARKKATQESSEDEDSDDNAQDISMKDKWWLKKWPRELNKEKESTWELGGHCRFRTQMYHTLLHYKFRLVLKVREKLEKNDINVAKMVADTSFIAQEVNRFTQLMDQAASKFGGSEHREYTDLWSEPRDAQEGSRPSGVGASLTPARMMNWLSSQTRRDSGNGGENIEQYD